MSVSENCTRPCKSKRKVSHSMKNTTLSEKQYAGNPHVRFDEGEVTSAKPGRGALLCKKLVAIFILGVASVSLCWGDAQMDESLKALCLKYREFADLVDEYVKQDCCVRLIETRGSEALRTGDEARKTRAARSEAQRSIQKYEAENPSDRGDLYELKRGLVKVLREHYEGLIRKTFGDVRKPEDRERRAETVRDEQSRRARQTISAANEDTAVKEGEPGSSGVLSSLFGIKLGETVDDRFQKYELTVRSRSSYPGLCYEFQPKKSFLGYQRYLVFASLKEKKIFQVMAIWTHGGKEGYVKTRELLEKKFSIVMSQKEEKHCDHCMYIERKSTGAVRILDVSVGGDVNSDVYSSIITFQSNYFRGALRPVLVLSLEDRDFKAPALLEWMQAEKDKEKEALEAAKKAEQDMLDAL